MSLRLSRFWLLLTLALPLLGLASAFGQPAEKPAETPTRLQPSTNTAAAAQNTGNLQQLEKDLFKPFQPDSLKSSLDGVSAQQSRPLFPPSVQQSKRAKELEDRRKEWIFMNPDDLTSAPSVEEVFGVSKYDKHGQEKEKLSPMQQYLQGIYGPKEPTPKKRSTEDDVLAPANGKVFAREPGSEEEPESQPGMLETERDIKKRIDANSSKETGKLGSVFTDIFGLGAKKEPVSKHELEAQKERMEQLRKLYGLPAAPSNARDPLNPLAGLLEPPKPAAAPAVSTHSLGTLSLPDTHLGAISVPTIANPSAMPDMTKMFTSPSLNPALPKQAPPKVTPPTPNFDAPRRQF